MPTLTHTRRTWDDRLVLTLERTFEVPVERVWQAVLAPGDWLGDGGRIEPVVGGDVVHGAATGRVVGMQPRHLLVYTAGDEVHRWELESVDGGCRLTLNDIVPSQDRLPENITRFEAALETLAAQLGS